MISNYIKTTVRTLLRQKSYSIINIVGLAIGLASCLIISMWIFYHLSFEKDQLYVENIVRPILDVNIDGISPLLHCGSFGWMGPELKENYPEVEDFVRIYQERTPFGLRADKTELTAYSYIFADQSLFDVFNFDFKYGDKNTALTEPNTLVISEEFSQKLFGDGNPVGSFIELGADPVKITGVLGKPASNTHLQFSLIMPFAGEWLDKTINSPRTKHDPHFHTYLRVAPNADLEALAIKTTHMLESHLPIFAGKLKAFYQPLPRMHLYSGAFEFDHLSRRKVDIATIYVFSAIALLILVIAGINFVNLTTACSLRRTKEVGIRKTIGAQKSSLITQFIGESILICLMAMVVAAGIVEASSPFLSTLFGHELDFLAVNRLQLYSGMLAPALLTGLLAGIYPAVFLSTPQPQEVLKANGFHGQKGSRLKRILVVAQFSISLVLIICSLFIGRQLHWLQNKNLGWDKDHVFSLPMPNEIRDNYEAVRQELLAHPDVNDVSALGPYDFPGFQGKQFHYENQPPDQSWIASCSAVDYNFLDMYGITLIEGRNFSREMASDADEAFIINETLKKKLGWETAVGKRFQLPDHREKWGTVIGVVKDFNFESLHHSIDGVALFIKPELFSHVSIKASTVTPDLLDFLREKWTAHAPNAMFDYYFLSDVYTYQYYSDNKTRTLVNTFTGIAIFIACLGLLGLVSHSTQQRTKEIGIRKTLGASVTHILLILTREIIVLLSMSLLIALPISWTIANRWLDGFAYRIGPSWWIYGVAGGLVLLVALATISVRTISAALANPVNSLKYE